MKVAVVGAGASGLMAAWAAAEKDCNVTVFDKNEKCGKKIYITGKGRCNLTCDCAPDEFLQNVVNNRRFLNSAIYNFSPADTINYFESSGLKLKKERGSRIFPVSDKASDVTATLEKNCKKVGVMFSLNEKVCDITSLQSTMFDITTEKSHYFFDKVIICTGGVSYPSTGSTGDGYKFANCFGHSVIKPEPALCGLNLKGSFYKQLQGLSLKNVRLTAYNADKEIISLFGEMQFTHFGISGPLVLKVSSLINRLETNKIKLVLDLKPALTYEQLDNRLLRDFNEFKNKSIANCLKALLPSAIIAEILKRSNISPDKKVNAVTKTERYILLTNIKNFDMLVMSLRGFEEAIITSGGVDVKNINPKTMESKLIKGLYFCGEVLDVDAFTGGFNLQIAFSTGYAAGCAVGALN